MRIEQMIIPDLMEQINAQRRLWKTIDRDTQLRIIAIIADLINRAIKTEIVTSNEGNEK
jgi:hypothetical protein